MISYKYQSDTIKQKEYRMIVSVLNQKGGAGKTTLSTNIARALQICGDDVLLVDADPQGSGARFQELRRKSSGS